MIKRKSRVTHALTVVFLAGAGTALLGTMMGVDGATPQIADNELPPGAIKQSTPSAVAPTPVQIVVPQVVRKLQGGLNNVAVLNSNSPEVVQTEGVLVSTLPPQDVANSQIHLDYPFNGQFDVFVHHIAKADPSDTQRTLYIGILLKNTTARPINVDVLSAASYLSQPDAPFVELPPMCDNASGSVFAGPGDRVTNEVLRGARQSCFPQRVTVKPHSLEVLASLPVPVKGLQPPLNGRSFLAKLRTSAPIYAATAALFSKVGDDGTERAPDVKDWTAVLSTGPLAGPREKPPTAPGSASGVIYGRVAGVAKGSQWVARITDDDKSARELAVPAAGTSISFPIATAEKGTLGTGQIQSAPMIVRESDTAYSAHGNYGVKYDITLPLVNRLSAPATIEVALQTPLKKDNATSLTFLEQPAKRAFFRGTVRVTTCGPGTAERTVYTHLVQRLGEQSEPLSRLSLNPHQKASVRLEFLYPPDATPPQVVTVRSL